MAKTRMLKHDLRTSLKAARWPIEVRYFWALLWGYLDDHGKGVDSPLLVKADCFPLDADITHEVIDGWLWLLAECGSIARYSNGGKEYIQAVNWKNHQKPPHPTKDVLPNWNDEKSAGRVRNETFMHPAGSPPASLPPGFGLNGVVSEVVTERADVTEMCELFADLLEANGSLRPKINQQWLDAARHILDKDKRDFTKTLNLIRWAQNDPFWKAACRSMPKFRTQYDAIRLKANAEFGAKNPVVSKPVSSVEDVVARRERVMQGE